MGRSSGPHVWKTEAPQDPTYKELLARLEKAEAALLDIRTNGARICKPVAEALMEVIGEKMVEERGRTDIRLNNLRGSLVNLKSALMELAPNVRDAESARYAARASATVAFDSVTKFLSDFAYGEST